MRTLITALAEAWRIYERSSRMHARHKMPHAGTN